MKQIVSRVVITPKTKDALKAYIDAKRKRFGVKTLQEEAINDFIQMAIPRSQEQIEAWELEMKVPEIK
jgi:hypothetical protein